MKNLYLRSCVALLCAVGLAACGGGNGTLALAGKVTGLTQPGLVLTNNGGSDLLVAANAVTFQFADLISTDARFNVEVKAGHQPTETVCTPSNNTGTASSSSTTTLLISCVTNAYKLTGNVSGLPDGAILVNGKAHATVAADGSFAFTPVAFGLPYTVAVQLPSTNGKTCTVTGGEHGDGSGLMVTGGVSNLVVNCVSVT